MHPFKCQLKLKIIDPSQGLKLLFSVSIHVRPLSPSLSLSPALPLPPSSLYISAFSSSIRVGSSVNAAAKGASILMRRTRILFCLTGGRKATSPSSSSSSSPHFVQVDFFGFS